MHKRTDSPPLSATARLVALYQNHVPVARWPRAEPDDRALLPIITNHHTRLRESLAIAGDAHARMSSPIAPAAAAAYLLADHDISLDDARRLLAPGDEELESDDPREALRRIMQTHAATPDVHEEHEALAYMLRAWNLWCSGATTYTIRWKPADGMPRIGSWAVDIPLPSRPTGDRLTRPST